MVGVDIPLRDAACGCPYPDCLRVKDYVGDGDTIYRVLNCVNCGDYQLKHAVFTCGHYQPGRTLGEVQDKNSFTERREAWHRERGGDRTVIKFRGGPSDGKAAYASNLPLPGETRTYGISGTAISAVYRRATVNGEDQMVFVNEATEETV